MKYAAITSMNQRYYDLCGHRLIDSYLSYVDFPLHVYNEDFEISNVTNMGWELGNDFTSFVERWQGKPRIVTFAKKAYSIIHALHNIDADYIIWFDADTVITKQFDRCLLSQLTDSKTLSSHFGVWHDNFFSCETGFFVINKTHPHFQSFLDIYQTIYNTDNYTKLRRFYDGEVYGYTIKQLETQNVKMQELNPNPHKYKTPMKHSLLGNYLKHYKSKSSKQELTYETC